MTSLPAPTEVVIGPPGTGKTTELLREVELVLESGVEPERIGYFAFTRRAATEAQERAMARFNLPRSRLPHFRTLHSECMRQTGLTSAQVLESDRLQEFSDWIGEEITGRFSMDEGLMSGYARGDRMLFMDNLARVRQRTLREQYEEDHDELDWPLMERFSRGLAEFKRARSLCDYTDMLEQYVQRPHSLGLHTCIFDEGQDLSPLQWSVAAELCRGSERTIVGGDDDQTIYKWAGADATFLRDLEGKTRVLGQSYRVPRSVQRVASEIIGRVHQRRSKDWAARDTEGSVRYVNTLDEIIWTGAPTLVLARNQYHLSPVMRQLRGDGILYEYHGQPSVKQVYLDGIVTWEKFRGGQPQTVAELRKMLRLMDVGVGVKRGHKSLPGLPESSLLTIETMRERGWLLAQPEIWHRSLTAIPAEERAYMVRCRRNGERFSQPPRIRVGTIHDSKGGERDRVVLLTDMAPRTFEEYHLDPESEHRVFYVGVTRAKEELIIVSPRTSRYYDI